MNRSKTDHTIWLIVVAIAGWAIPGGGHFLIRQRKHAAVIFITISITFAIGLYVGSVGIINPVSARLWYLAQMLTSPLVGILGQITTKGDYQVYGHAADTGQIYTALAGLLNLLCVLNAVYRAYSGIGELIGREESDA